MPALSDYTSGTITLTNGSTAFTGSGTGWQAADFREGDTILGIEDNAGVEYVIATISGNGVGTLTQEWEGATGTYQYRMRYMADGARVTAQARNLIELLGNGNLQALAGLTGPGVPVFNGPHAMVIKPEADFINGVAYDVQVDTLPDRAAYDGQTAGFAVLVSDVGDGRSALYTKVTNASGDWSDPAYITGPSITLDVTEVDEVPYGAPPDVTLTPRTGGYDLAFEIPRGMIIEPGDTTTVAADQDAAVTFVPITGGYRLDIALPRGPAGDIDGVTTFWQTRITNDATAAAARAGLNVAEKQSSPADATVGRGLIVGAFGLGATASTLISTGSFNDLVRTGWYYTVALSDGPVSGTFNVQVIGEAAGGGRCVQTAYLIGANTRVFIRRQTNGSWADWAEQWHSISAPLVSQTEAESGTVTGPRTWSPLRVKQAISALGGISEHGNNANGEYVRFADGTQICTRSLIWDPADGDGQVFEFPAAFIPPTEGRIALGMGTQASGTAAFREASYNSGVASGSDAASWVIYSSLTSNNSIGIGLSAIGRWF